MPENNQYDNEKRFAIFPNSRKEAGSQQPDYSGELTLNGVKYRIAGWRNTSKGGVTYLSGSISVFEERGDAPQAQAATAAPTATPSQSADTDMPF